MLHHSHLGVTRSTGAALLTPWSHTINRCCITHTLESHDQQVLHHSHLGVARSTGAASLTPWSRTINMCCITHTLESHDQQVLHHSHLGVTRSMSTATVTQEINDRSKQHWLLNMSKTKGNKIIGKKKTQFYISSLHLNRENSNKI